MTTVSEHSRAAEDGDTRGPREHGALLPFHPAVREWFAGSFPAPTRAQAMAWPALVAGASTLLLAPTGSGKTLAAFLHALDRLLFPSAGDVPATAAPATPVTTRTRAPHVPTRVLYVSPLKALAVDVERNLRAPLAGIARIAATRGVPFRDVTIAIRTGDTPQRERAAMARHPPDILITTPESLFLLLTSAARETLRHLETVIIDEIHALVPTKRGSHLALSLERLEALIAGGAADGAEAGAAARRPLQRIGLSATQRPLEEVARFLGGGDRHVDIVDAGEPKRLDLTVAVAVEDMARPLPPAAEIPSGPTSQAPPRPSIWTAIHPQLLALVRAHRSTLIFVNSRRVAERLAGALNELAEETLVYAHHGSLARAQRVEIEDRLKSGRIRGLVATSSLELGIDMGAIDLVVQIEAPPSVASGLQRIGRAGHQVGAVSRGVIIPKYRGDLVACAAITRAMHEGAVESTRYPRNPLDVLAQQVVAAVSMDTWPVDELYALVRRAAPFAELPRASFEGVLDMLSGRYPSDEFAELRPRLTWDRLRGVLSSREGAKRVAITNAGTIPDRGLYAVFLATADGKPAAQHRVGELDEEMVFESKAGDTFILGASTWRIEQITHDRVFVTPAPGEPGRMPFWKADGPARPLELGQRIGCLMRELGELPPAAAAEQLVRHHDLDERAADNLLAYLADQRDAAGVVPDEHTIVIERCRDELGDWRVCVLSPLGGQVLAPWTMAVTSRLREELAVDVESMWTDDGFVVRLVDTDAPFDPSLFVPAADDVERLILRQLGGSALFAATFREVAGRALLLPKRRPGARAPLWQLRKRAADLLAVASGYGSFPMLLEAYRECLRDRFDLPALVATLRAVEERRIRVVTRTSERPSPFATSLLFGFVANFLYDGDAPLAERRAAALAIDHGQLRELLGDVELRELLDPEVVAAVEAELQHTDPRFAARSTDGLHDLLLRLGDLSRAELTERSATPSLAATIDELVAARRVLLLPFPGGGRYLAVEHASQVRDALGLPLPPGLPAAFLAAVTEPLLELVARYARTHGPFGTAELAARYGVAPATLEPALRRLVAAGRLAEGAFRPGGQGREWCAPDVLAQLRRRSLARLRREVEPVAPAILGRLVQAWHGTSRRRRGLDALLDTVERLAGAPLAASLLESEILPARLDGYQPEDLDTLVAAGEVVWVGLEPLGEHDGRLALYLADQLPALWRLPTVGDLTPTEERILTALGRRGALFFPALRDELGGGFPSDLLDSLWGLVWRGLVANDTIRALRGYVAPADRQRRHPERGGGVGFRPRRALPAGAEGRWSLTRERLPTSTAEPLSTTAWAAATAQQLLARHGVVARGLATSENLPGGWSGVYEVLKRLEEAGRVRRGYFAAGVGAMQFAQPAALELLRSLREPSPEAEVVVLAATDPANPFGGLLRWPDPPASATASGRQLLRVVGARVILVDGALAGYLPRGGRALLTFLPDDEVDRARRARALAERLAALARSAHREPGELGGRSVDTPDGGRLRGGALLLAEIDGRPAAESPIAPFLLDAGFVATSHGLMVRRLVPRRPGA
jgi:ATP-dependent Lhr-like helicase